MFTLVLLALVPGDVDVLDSKDFPKETQVKALTATVRVVNGAKGGEGSGALVHKSGPFLYVLTAAHVVAGAKKVEVVTFTTASHPKAAAVYRGAEVLAQSAEADLAVLRIATRDDPPGCLRHLPPRVGAGGEESGGAGRGLRRGRRAELHPRSNQGQAQGPQARGRGGRRLLGGRAYTGEGAIRRPAPGPARPTHRRGQRHRRQPRAITPHTEEIHAFLKRNALEWLYEEKADK